MTGEPTRERNERLVRAYLDHELDAARGFLEDRLAHLFPGGFLGRLGNVVARGLWHAIGEHEVRRRVRGQLDLTAAAARDLERHGLPEALARWTDEALAHEEVVHRGDRAHPAFPEVERRLREAFARRVEALAPVFAHAGAAEGYDDLVRGAYPTRAEAEPHLAWQIRHARELTDLVRRSPGLLRFPRPLLVHLFRLVDDATDWWEARSAAELDRIYGRP